MSDPEAVVNDEFREQHLSCPICFEAYNKERIPKFLPCGHTFCHKCIPTFLTDSMTCPLCKKHIRGSKDEEFPTNFAIHGMIESKKTDRAEGLNSKWKDVEEAMKSMRRSVEGKTYHIEKYVREMASFVKECEKEIEKMKAMGIEDNQTIRQIEENIRKKEKDIHYEEKKIERFGSFMKTSIVPTNVHRNYPRKREAHEEESGGVQQNREAERSVEGGQRAARYLDEEFFRLRAQLHELRNPQYLNGPGSEATRRRRSSPTPAPPPVNREHRRGFLISSSDDDDDGPGESRRRASRPKRRR